MKQSKEKKKKDGTPSKQGEGGGKPLKYATEEDLLFAGLSYFTEIKQDKKRIATKAGLCLALDISRDTYSEYRKKFPDTIRAFDMRMETAWTERLAGNGATGAIFYLKNAFHKEYKDRVETDITSKGEQIHIYVPQRK